MIRQESNTEMNKRSSQIHKGPSPLDAYLSHSEKLRPAEKIVADRLQDVPTVQHYADAKRILRNVQTKRNNLESNLNAIVRQSDEEHLFTAVDSMIQQAQGVETLRIRKDVDRVIKEMNLAVKKEIEDECKSSEVQPEPTTTANQESNKPKTRHQPGTVMSKRQPRKTSGKENVVDPKTIPKKPKIGQPSSARMKTVPKPESKPVSKPVNKPVPKPESKPVSKPVNKPKPGALTQPETYLTSVYGRQSYHPQRTTSKAPYLHYQSPVNPRTVALTSAILGAGSRVPSKPVSHHETPKPIQITNREVIPRKKTPRYYFHPEMDMSHVVPSGEGRVNLDTPVKGYMVPMAIPLGKPKTDQSLRLPLTMVTSAVRDTETTTPKPSPVPRKMPTQNKPNVAVITIRDKELSDKSTDHKEKKGKNKSKRHADLGVQILPPMDIDSFSESSDYIAAPSPPFASVSDISVPFTRPDNSDYEDFRQYLTVRDTEPGLEKKDDDYGDDDDDDDDDDVPRIPTPENHLTVRGHTEKDHLYHGPPFPPQHPPLFANIHPGVLDAENRVNKTMEDRAVEWVEQELLARIVSEMNRPLPDPTLLARTPPESSPDSSIVTDDGHMLAATIGLGGIQLFVDAGIPVDYEFVARLIRDVIAEQIVSTLGYPKPTATPSPPQDHVQTEAYSPEPATTPVSTPLPTPVYTPVESEVSEPHSPLVATPDPSTILSESSVSIESAGEPIPVKELSESEVSEARSPMPTPVATPTGSHTPTESVSTPMPSTLEPEYEVGSPVPTPDATERTPITPPQSSTISTPPVDSTVSTPKPPVLASSPSSLTTSTLSTPGTTSTMTTIDEELSEGQLLQPYVHMGQFSEGEYTAAFSPGVERKMCDEALDVMGKDEDSRNHLIRVALNGLLRRSLGSSSSTVSAASTLKDTDDIREDSLGVYASEGEIIFPRDQVPESYGLRTTGPNSTSSEGELVSTHRSHGTSPGEFRSVLEANISTHSPGEISTRPNPPHRTQLTTTHKQVEKEPASPENTESRSLHTSDLKHKKRKAIGTQQSVGIQQSGSNGAGILTLGQENKGPQYEHNEYLPSGVEESNKTSSNEIKKPASRTPASRPPPIHVPIPFMDESSLNSEERPGDEQEDTYGDVSSISGGDF